MTEYRIVVHEEPAGGYWAEVTALPGCYSQGETVSELMDNVRDAIGLCLDVLREDAQARLSPEAESY